MKKILAIGALTFALAASAAVPATVSTPENSEGSDCDTVFEMFSISLVMRLITSPWLWSSRYLTGRSITFPNSSPRIRATIL